MSCIFCDNPEPGKSIEHIVSESFGNKRYVLDKGEVCDPCNNRFSGFEGVSLSNTIFGMERAIAATVTKKGNAVKSRIGGMTIEGSKNFTKGLITLKNLNEVNITDFDAASGTFKLVVPAFEKTEVPTSKLLLKMGLESLFKSKPEIYHKYDFTDLRQYLTVVTNTDWPFVMSKFEHDKFTSIPTFLDKFLLKKERLELLYSEVDAQTLLFKFRFRAISMIVNLVNRNLHWVAFYEKNSGNRFLYPEHFNKKYQRLMIKKENDEK